MTIHVQTRFYLVQLGQTDLAETIIATVRERPEHSELEAEDEPKTEIKEKVGEETVITVNRQIQTALRHIAQYHQCFQNSPVVQLLHQEEELQAARRQSLFKTL